jgi:hypothetical protein
MFGRLLQSLMAPGFELILIFPKSADSGCGMWAAKTQKRSAQKPKLSEETVTPVSDQALAEVYDAVMRHRITDLTTIQRIIHQLKQWRLILNAASKWTSMQSRARTCCAITSITFSSASKRTWGSSGAAQPILSRMFYPLKSQLDHQIPRQRLSDNENGSDPHSV